MFSVAISNYSIELGYYFTLTSVASGTDISTVPVLPKILNPKVFAMFTLVDFDKHVLFTMT